MTAAHPVAREGGGVNLYVEHIESALAAYRVELALTDLRLWQYRLAKMVAGGWQICFPLDELAVAVTAGKWSVRQTPPLSPGEP